MGQASHTEEAGSCASAATGKQRVLGRICPGGARKDFPGVTKGCAGSQTPWKKKPEGLLLLGFCESPLWALKEGSQD